MSAESESTMNIRNLEEDALFIYRIVLVNTENGNQQIMEYGDAHEALQAAVRMLKATPDNICAEMQWIVKAPYRRAQEAGHMMIYRHMNEL